jgi:type II restriction enzyme
MPANKYNEILTLIDDWVDGGTNDFPTMSRDIEGVLGKLKRGDLVEVVEQIGVIPEKYEHDSTHEKLYAKMSDCVISFVFRQLGFEAKVLSERGDSADVIARSKYHRYEFVGDAKVFRLSRTAKNQKDFKINSMDKWRGDSDFAVVVCPLYQYPSSSSAIYAQVLDTGVALNSFEHLLFCLAHGITESAKVSLKTLFNYPGTVSSRLAHAERKQAKPIFDALNLATATACGKTLKELEAFKAKCLLTVSSRAKFEKAFWEDEVGKIQKMTLQEAREALIASRKIRSKIECISEYIID